VANPSSSIKPLHEPPTAKLMTQVPPNAPAGPPSDTKVTDRPVVVFLSAVLAAFLAGVGVYTFLQSHIATSVDNYLQINKDHLPPGPSGPPGFSIPIGGIIMWSADRRTLPDGFEICDGNPATNLGAAFKGTKPDLVDRFPKGAPRDRLTNEQLRQGGSHNLPAHHHVKGTLRVAGGGEHSHAPATCDDDHGSERPALAVGDLDNPETGPGITGGTHSHSIEGSAGAENGVDGDGADTSGANQPAYSEVFFLIRVK